LFLAVTGRGGFGCLSPFLFASENLTTANDTAYTNLKQPTAYGWGRSIVLVRHLLLT